MMKKKFSMIAAMSQNRVIGNNNQLPWHMPADLKYFKRLTLNNTVIMGRKTYESIGKPLPNRQNIIITSNPDAIKTPENADNFVVVSSLIAAFELAKHPIFIIGGSSLFQELLNEAHQLYITLIEAEINGDVYFPEINNDEWKLISSEAHEADEKNEYDYQFLVYERK